MSQEWLPDPVWLNIVALSGMEALRDIADSVFRNDGLWRQWYDAEAPETAHVPDYEERLTKFERMCVVKVGRCAIQLWLNLPYSCGRACRHAGWVADIKAQQPLG